MHVSSDNSNFEWTVENYSSRFSRPKSAASSASTACTVVCCGLFAHQDDERRDRRTTNVQKSKQAEYRDRERGNQARGGVFNDQHRDRFVMKIICPKFVGELRVLGKKKNVSCVCIPTTAVHYHVPPANAGHCAKPPTTEGGEREGEGEAMRYCDHHGWRWEPGQGPSPCIGETASYLLAFAVFLYAVAAIRGVQRGLHRVTYDHRSCAYAVHAFQMVLSVAQGVLAVAGGVLIARPRGMLCVALSLHSVSWAVSWTISALALLRCPASSKRLMWFWCCALITNRWVSCAMLCTRVLIESWNHYEYMYRQQD